jgi:hypothetical protein
MIAMPALLMLVTPAVANVPTHLFRVTTIMPVLLILVTVFQDVSTKRSFVECILVLILPVMKFLVVPTVLFHVMMVTLVPMTFVTLPFLDVSTIP